MFAIFSKEPPAGGKPHGSLPHFTLAGAPASPASDVAVATPAAVRRSAPRTKRGRAAPMHAAGGSGGPSGAIVALQASPFLFRKAGIQLHSRSMTVLLLISTGAGCLGAPANHHPRGWRCHARRAAGVLRRIGAGACFGGVCGTAKTAALPCAGGRAAAEDRGRLPSPGAWQGGFPGAERVRFHSR